MHINGESTWRIDMELCKFCGSKVHAKQLCKIHYGRMRSRGTPDLTVKLGRGASIADRLAFHSRKNENGCLEWTGYRLKRGYAMLTVYTNGKAASRYAHRLAYSEQFGEIPKGMVVCHSCDNPSCINPSHLFLGTQKENLEDMRSKGRENRRGGEGSRNSHAKLQESDVINIRLSALSNRELANAYSVSIDAIRRARSGEAWKSVQRIE